MKEQVLCTPDQPYDGRPGVCVQHTGAHEVRDSQRNGYPSGDMVEMKCRDCGTTWTTELPQ